MTADPFYRHVEILHLTFLRFLEHQVSKSHYALKGGCNLRFFFKSIRYSEDIDLDIWTTPPDRLTERVNRILHAKDFHNALQAKEIELLNIRAHKQTDTTQRWKMCVKRRGAAAEFPTKIEFSRRARQDQNEAALELVDPELVGRYGVAPVLVTHYLAGAAFAQKVSALLNRKETQARDVFDLHHLSQRGGDAAAAAGRLADSCAAMTERILAVDYETFCSQVVIFLEPGYQDYYRERSRWEQIQLNLIDFMEKAK